MALLVDTDLLIEFEREMPEPLLEVIRGQESAISVITVSELLHGVHRATGATKNKRSAFVERILGEFKAIPITEPVARVHAELWAELSAHGTEIGVHDSWIGATALAHGLGVATRNARDFERIPGLRVVSPA